MNFAGRLFESHSDFYLKTYPEAVIAVKPAGRTGAMLMRSQQAAGNWSSAATPDLVIVRPKTHGIRAALNLGAGEFRAVSGSNRVSVRPPLVAARVLVEAAYSQEVLSVPYKGLKLLVGDDAHLPADGDFGALHASMHEDSEIALLFDRLFRESEAGSPSGALYADGALLQISARLLGRHVGIPGKTRSLRGGLAPWQIKRVCEAMIAAMDAGQDESNLAELALLVGLSANHLCRGFAQSTGQPPHRWMAERRIERAKVLMIDPSLSLTDIALTVGYTSQNTFGRAFTRLVGINPSEWRRNQIR